MWRGEARAEIGDTARQYRTVSRALLFLTAVLGLAMVAALRGTLPKDLASPALYLGAASALAAAWSGQRGHRIALEERERASSRAMVILVAAQLARQDDDALSGIVQRGGPAAEAAAMVLAGRKPKPPKGVATDAQGLPRRDV
jgi:hypothetical protein